MRKGNDTYFLFGTAPAGSRDVWNIKKKSSSKTEHTSTGILYLLGHLRPSLHHFYLNTVCFPWRVRHGDFKLNQTLYQTLYILGHLRLSLHYFYLNTVCFTRRVRHKYLCKQIISTLYQTFYILGYLPWFYIISIWTLFALLGAFGVITLINSSNTNILNWYCSRLSKYVRRMCPLFVSTCALLFIINYQLSIISPESSSFPSEHCLLNWACSA